MGKLARITTIHAGEKYIPCGQNKNRRKEDTLSAATTD